MQQVNKQVPPWYHPHADCHMSSRQSCKKPLRTKSLQPYTSQPTLTSCNTLIVFRSPKSQKSKCCSLGTFFSWLLVSALGGLCQVKWDTGTSMLWNTTCSLLTNVKKKSKQDSWPGMVALPSIILFLTFSLNLKVLASTQCFQKSMLADLPNYPKLTDLFG